MELIHQSQVSGFARPPPFFFGPSTARHHYEAAVLCVVCCVSCLVFDSAIACWWQEKRARLQTALSTAASGNSSSSLRGRLLLLAAASAMGAAVLEQMMDDGWATELTRNAAANLVRAVFAPSPCCATVPRRASTAQRLISHALLRQLRVPRRSSSRDEPARESCKFFFFCVVARCVACDTVTGLPPHPSSSLNKSRLTPNGRGSPGCQVCPSPLCHAEI